MRRYRRVRRYRRTGRRNQSGFAGILLVICLVAVAGIVVFEAGVAPLMKAYAENAAVRLATEAVEEAVKEELEEGGEDYGSFLTIDRSSSGEILAVSTDMAKINLLKSGVTERINEKIGGEHAEIGVPLGTLLGGSLFHGRGPEIPLLVTLAGNVQTDFQTEFESAGINQTRHLIYLDVCAGVYAFLPGVHEETSFSTRVQVSETVIVGQVPQTNVQLTG